MSLPNPREYDIGTCYGCQKCLFCFKDLRNNFCACDLTKKPSRTDTFPNRTIRGRQIHNRCYKTYKTRVAQVNWLKECDKFFGYESDFNKNFDLTLCSACNSKHDRGKSLNYLDDQSNISISDQDDEIEIINLTELKVMLIIDTKKTNSPPGKWLVFTTEEVNNFYSFQLSLNCHIQKHLDIQFISNDDYELSYKINGRGQAMCINDRDDFLNFINECKELDTSAKKMYIYISLKNPEKSLKRKLKVLFIINILL